MGSPAVYATVADLRRALRGAGKVGFVPTMGALHEGHVSLLRRARLDTEYVLASIFVNPTQFGPGEDFEKYPRMLEADLEACAGAGVDGVFAPDARVMYPEGNATTVRVAGLPDTLCGAFRPGHFDGVSTVVAKLFGAVGPCTAYFGQKDAQQAAIIRRMVRDLLLPVTVRVLPIVRDEDGLALSSRNRYLSPEERREALALPRAISLGVRLVASGEREAERICKPMRASIESNSRAFVEYLKVVDPRDMRDVAVIDGKALIAGAVRVGETRLIDNALVRPGVGEVSYDA